jgi:hypothetical protein
LRYRQRDCWFAPISNAIGSRFKCSHGDEKKRKASLMRFKKQDQSVDVR